MNSQRLKRRHVLAGCGLLGVMAFAACDDYERASDQAGWASRNELDNVPLDTALALVDQAHGTVFMVDGHGGTPHAKHVEIGRAPVKFEKRNGHDQLLVLTQGVVGTKAIKGEPAALYVVPATGAPATVIPLGSRYTNFTQSPDGLKVILFFGGKSVVSGEVAFNPNELAIVDFVPPPPVPAPSVTTRTLTGLATAPKGIEFSPQLALARQRAIVLVRSENFVTLLDLDPTQPDVTIPLTLPEEPKKLNVVQVVWDVVTPRLFLRVDSGSDIFSIRFAPLAADSALQARSDFRAVLSQLAAGPTPADMALYDAGDGLRLLVAGGQKNVTVIDPASSRTVTVPIEHDVRWISTWTPPLSATGAAPLPRALLASSNEAKVTFVELQKLESLKTKNLDVLLLSAPAKDFVPFPGPGVVVVQHPNNSITVIDLFGRAASPLNTTIGINKLRYRPFAPETLWLITPRERLGFMSLLPGARAVTDVLLDEPVDDLMVTSAMLEPGGKAKLIVLHKDASGSVTVLDAAAPTRQGAKSMRGIVTTDLLERTQRNVP